MNMQSVIVFCVSKPGKNPSYAFAFKSILTHEEAEVIVKEVTWAGFLSFDKCKEVLQKGFGSILKYTN